MTNNHHTQSTPLPPKRPFYLSPDELRACEDFVKNNIDGASSASLQILRGLANHLLNEVIHFMTSYPAIDPAGLMLTVDILLPIEVVNEDEWLLADEEKED